MSLRLSQVAHYFVKHSFSRSIAVLKRDNWKALMFLGYTLVVSFSLQPASWTSSQNEFTDFIIDQNGNHEWHGNQPPGPAVNYRRNILYFRTPIITLQTSKNVIMLTGEGTCEVLYPFQECRIGMLLMQSQILNQSSVPNFCEK